MKVKMLFVIMALSITLLLSGCTSDYDLVIDENNSVTETFKVTISNDILLTNNDDIELFLDNRIASYKNINAYRDYQYDRKVGKNTSYIKMTEKYKTLKEYSDSPFMKNVFQNLTIIKNDKFTTFKTVGKYFHEYIYGAERTDEGESGAPTQVTMGDVNITIKLHNKLIESNADIEDKENNIYTWKLTKDSKEEYIYLKYSNEKRYDIIFKDFISNYIFTIILVGVVIGVVLTIFLVIGGKHLINNRI